MTLKELKEKTAEEIKKTQAQLTEELFRLKIKKAQGQLQKPHRLGEIRRDLARILTLKNQQQKGLAS